MKKLKNQRGILLLCTLVIMVILSVLLMVGVYRMQSSVMTTKRVIWEIKSYWAARAGNTIAADGCIRSVQWPNNSLITHAGGKKSNGTEFGYKIAFNDTKKIVTGTDENSDSNFTIYYINHLLSKYSNKQSSSVSETTLQNNFNKMSNDVSNVPTGEMYCLTAGKSGVSVVGLELAYQLNYNPGLLQGNKIIKQSTMQSGQSINASAAIYAGGNITANLKNTFSVKSDGSTRPCIVTGGSLSITSSGITEKPNQDGEGPLNLEEGSIFVAEDSNATINDQPISPSNTNTNLTEFGVNVYPNTSVEVTIPKLNTFSGKTIPAGTFCFVEMPNDYATDEFDETFNVLKECSLTAREFYNNYGDPILTKVEENHETENANQFLDNINNAINNKFSSEDIVKFDTSFGQEIFDEETEQFIRDKIEEPNGDGIFDWLISKFANLFANTDEEILFIKKLYRYYLLDQILTIVNKYKTTEDSKYEAFFIPANYAGIERDLNYDSLNLDYSTFAKARALANLDEKIASEDTTPFLIKYLSEKFDATIQSSDSNNTIENKLKDYKNKYSNDDNVYITECINEGDNPKFYILNRLSDHNIGTKEDYAASSIASNFSATQNNISFESSNTDLIMKVNGSIKANDGFFNFATFERSDSGNRYTQATNRRAAVELGGNGQEGSISASSINIKGFVYGDGHLQSTATNSEVSEALDGNITFEAVGSGIDSGRQNWVSILSSNNIFVKRVSASNSGDSESNTTSSSDFRGILYAKNNIYINVGNDNLDFSVEGTIICGQNMVLNGVNNLNVVYNPRLSGIVIKQFIPNIEELNNYLSNSIEQGTDHATINTGIFKFVNRI